MSHKGQNSLMCVRVVSCGSVQSQVGQTSLMLVRQCNVEKSSLMLFKGLLDCHKVQHNFLEVWQVLEHLESFKIFLDGPRLLSWSLKSPGMSCKLQNIFLQFLKVSWIARMSKITFLKFYKSWMSCKLQNIFLYFSKISWIARMSKRTFLKSYKSWNV